jgi:TolA-binding protein
VIKIIRKSRLAIALCTSLIGMSAYALDKTKKTLDLKERQSAANFNFSKRSSNLDLDARADEKRNEAIDKLKKLMPQLSEGQQKGELIFRLAEMFWAKSHYNDLVAMQKWDEALDAWRKQGKKGDEPKAGDSREKREATQYRSEALKLYEKILAHYPSYPRTDEVLYNLGSSLYDIGDKQKGVTYYWRLIKEHPTSDFAPDAWLELGEHFFNANQLTNAVKAYTKAAETRKPRIYSYATYKLAWCDYNAQNYTAALAKFREVIAYAKQQRVGSDGIGDKDRIQLMDESLRDMLKTYSHLDEITDAFKFYTDEVGAEKAYRYLLQLGQIYGTEGKHALQIKTFQELNDRYPFAEQAPQNQTAIMNAYAALNNNEQVRKEVRRLVDLYSPNGPWAERNVSKPDILKSAFEAVESELAGLVVEQHRAAQTAKLSETYLLARDLYKEYLDKFTETANTYKFRFFYSEILFELKDFAKAADSYARVVTADPKGEFVKPAAYTAVLAWEKVASGTTETVGKKIEQTKAGKDKGLLQKLEHIDKLKEGESYEVSKLTDVEQKLADACDKFVQVAPDDTEVAKVKFKSARLYYIHNQFEQAAMRFGEIIDKYPKDELARLGAESIVQSFNVRKDWLALGTWARKFQSNANLMADKTFATKIGEFVEGASFNEVHYLIEPKGNLKETADRYFAFVKEFPRSKFAKVALFNSVLYYDKANLLELAVVASQKLISEYKTESQKTDVLDKEHLPKLAELRERTLFLLATFHERLADFSIAADLYEQYASEFPKGEHYVDALYNAGLFREGLRQYSKALQDFQAYLAAPGEKSDAVATAWRIGLIYEKQKNAPQTQRYFETLQASLAKTDPAQALCAQYKVAQALKAQHRDKEATQQLDKLVSEYNKLPQDKRDKVCLLDGVAWAAFSRVDSDYDNYQAIDLKGSEKEMAQKLIKKLKMVDELQARYVKVLAIGQGEYGLASLYRIAAMYQHLATALQQTECPKKLTEDQCGIYQGELQQQAAPLEDKAIEGYKKALEKAYELALYNDWLRKSQEALKVYEPEKFPEVRDIPLVSSSDTSTAPKILTVLAGGAS